MTYFCDYAEIVCHYPIKPTVFSNVSSFHAMSWITFAVSNRNRKWESLFYVPLTLHSWIMCTNSAIWTITSCCYHSWPTARHITYLHIRTKQKNTKGSILWEIFPWSLGLFFIYGPINFITINCMNTVITFVATTRWILEAYVRTWCVRFRIWTPT